MEPRRYGLGTIYLKQEKYQLAEYHFRRALEINPRNSVLHCYRGMALLSNQTYDQAIAVLQKAKEMDPGLLGFQCLFRLLDRFTPWHFWIQ